MSEWVSMLGNAISGITGSVIQNDMARKNAEYQWDRFYSPRAQVNNLAEAGINPAVVFGNQSPVMSSGGQLTMPDAPALGLGTTALAEIGQYINATANAKKAGVDTRSSEEDIKLKQIEQKRNDFELRLRNQFGLKQAAQDLALSEANVRLAQLGGDNAELDKAIKEYTKAKEKAMSEVAENQRDILGKELANKDTELRLSNRVLKTQGDSNIASANASNASAAASRAQANIFEIEKDIKKLERKFRESTNVQEIETKLSELRKQGIINDTEYEEGKKRLDSISKFNQARENSKVVENGYLFFDWLGDIISKPFKNILPKK